MSRLFLAHSILGGCVQREQGAARADVSVCSREQIGIVLRIGNVSFDITDDHFERHVTRQIRTRLACNDHRSEFRYGDAARQFAQQHDLMSNQRQAVLRIASKAQQQNDVSIRQPKSAGLILRERVVQFDVPLIEQKEQLSKENWSKSILP